jgi:hypothetical protein
MSSIPVVRFVGNPCAESGRERHGHGSRGCTGIDSRSWQIENGGTIPSASANRCARCAVSDVRPTFPWDSPGDQPDAHGTARRCVASAPPAADADVRAAPCRNGSTDRRPDRREGRGGSARASFPLWACGGPSAGLANDGLWIQRSSIKEMSFAIFCSACRLTCRSRCARCSERCHCRFCVAAGREGEGSDAATRADNASLAKSESAVRRRRHTDGPVCALLRHRNRMPTLSLEDVWMNSKPAETLLAPLSVQQSEGAEEEGSWPSETRIASRPDSISAKAVLGSLLGMGALGAGSLLLMYSLVHRGGSGSVSPGVAEPQPTTAQVAILTPIPTPTSTWTPTSFPIPTWTPAAAATANLTSAKPIATPPSSPVPRATKNNVHRWILYPLPVPLPAATVETRGAPAAEPHEAKTPGSSPQATATTMTTSAGPPRQTLATQRQAANVPDDDLFGSRE